MGNHDCSSDIKGEVGVKNWKNKQTKFRNLTNCNPLICLFEKKNNLIHK